MPSVIADPPRSGGSWRIIAVGKAARAMAIASARSAAPSSTAGRMWQCRSIIGFSVGGSRPGALA
ncbi:MAG: hypothetical protein ABGW82_02485, partial [Paracoccus sp. (in: a-proteobacteria)]